jgi:LysR family transcriptional regulator, cys regulon transcriptional activator
VPPLDDFTVVAPDGPPDTLMKLIQLRYLVAVAENDLNITQAARSLHAAQPGVSKQLKQLEDELGFRLFERKGRALLRATDAGAKVIDRASQIVRQTRSIKALAAELRKDEAGSLSIATTHTQARYVLPAVLKRFRDKYPKVRLHLHQGNSEQIAELAATDRIDIAIATGASPTFAGLVRLPCYRWHRTIVVPHDHPLAEVSRPSFADLARYPLVTYSFSFSGPASLVELFAHEGVTPNVALTAWDSDVIKKYVREGLGVGILANVAIDGEEDSDLKVRDASHLFPAHTTWAGFRRGVLLRGFMVDFLQMLAPHLTARQVQLAENAASQDEVDKVFAGVKIPYGIRPQF